MSDLYQDEIVLIVLSTITDNQLLVDKAIQYASEDTLLLVVLYVIDQKKTSKLMSNLADQGYVGEKAGIVISNSILKDYKENKVAF